VTDLLTFFGVLDISDSSYQTSSIYFGSRFEDEDEDDDEGEISGTRVNNKFSNIETFTMAGLRTFSLLFATILAAVMAQTVTAKLGEQREPRLLDVMIGNSDEFAESKVTLRALERPVGINSQDHAKITSILSTTKELISTANSLINNEETFQAGSEMMEEANALFREATGHIARRMLLVGDESHMVRKKYSEHDIEQAKNDEERALDVTRSIYEVVSHSAAPIFHLHTLCANSSSFISPCI
jgi:hypothetical protein